MDSYLRVLETPLYLGGTIAFIECEGSILEALSNIHQSGKGLHEGIFKRLTILPNGSRGVEILYENSIVCYKLGNLSSNQRLILGGVVTVPELRVGITVISNGLRLLFPAVITRCVANPGDRSIYTVIDNKSSQERSVGEGEVWYGEVYMTTVKGAVINTFATGQSVNDPTLTDDSRIFLNRMELRHAIVIPNDMSVEHLLQLRQHVINCLDIRPGDMVTAYNSIIDASRNSSDSIIHRGCRVISFCYQEHDNIGARIKIQQADGSVGWMLVLQLRREGNTTMWNKLFITPGGAKSTSFDKTWERRHLTGDTNVDAAPKSGDDMILYGKIIVWKRRSWIVVAASDTHLMLKSYNIIFEMTVPALGVTKFDDTKPSKGKWIEFQSVPKGDIPSNDDALSSVSFIEFSIIISELSVEQCERFIASGFCTDSITGYLHLFDGQPMIRDILNRETGMGSDEFVMNRVEMIKSVARLKVSSASRDESLSRRQQFETPLVKRRNIYD